MILADTSAERAVLAGIFTYGDTAYMEISDIINENTFTVDSNVVIYKCLKKLCETNSQIDIASIYSVAQELSVIKILEKKEEAQHLRAIMDFPVSLNNIRKFAAKIRKLEITRLLRKQLELAQDKLLEINGTEPIGSILGIAEDTVFNFTNLLNDSEDAPHHIANNLEEYIKELEGYNVIEDVYECLDLKNKNLQDYKLIEVIDTIKGQFNHNVLKNLSKL